MDKPGVVGYGLSTDLDDHTEIHVYVETASDGVDLPPFINNKKVKTVVTGKIVALPKPTCGTGNTPPCDGGGGGDGGGDTCGSLALSDRTDYVSAAGEPTISLGESVGAYSITACTLGAVVYDNDSGDPKMLSNNHCFADVNQRLPDDDICSPGPIDAQPQLSCNRIGGLDRYKEIDFGGGTNIIDAALASIDDNMDQHFVTDPCYGPIGSTTVAPSKGVSVQKYGRTTGFTKGTIDSTSAVVNVEYGGGRTARFENQIVIVGQRRGRRILSFSKGGDSGSLIVTADGGNNPVGLLYAGSDTYTIANPIDEVLSQLGVTFSPNA